jgi:hypothetical protein
MHNCLVCDKELIKKKYESRARFAKKKFCSQKCSRKYLKENHLGWFAQKKYIKKNENNIT